jgi:hypothetical protein
MKYRKETFFTLTMVLIAIKELLGWRGGVSAVQIILTTAAVICAFMAATAPDSKLNKKWTIILTAIAVGLLLVPLLL